MREIELEVNAAEFRKSLGLKDGITPTVDYSKITKDVLEKIVPPKDGKPGKDAERVNEEKIIAKILKEVLKRLPEGDTMNQVGYASGGANQITYKGAGTRLSDYVQNLDFSTGLSASYSDGTITITGTSSTTKVRDEAFTTPGTTFTLAHTPVANTLQVFRGGARQQVGSGNDYTISGVTITLANALVSGEILLCDYEY